ncbi:MAG: tetratricopeptide repeat protein, partial [SAR324 cluster bacterium]|nr:tetratricopeptide repeat protein [SAR324 cluster bacterium]
FYPIIEQFQRGARFARDDTPEAKLDKMEGALALAFDRVEEVAPLVASLLSIPVGDRYPPLTLSPQRLKEKTIEAMVELLAGLSRHYPVLIIFEDAQWIDPSSLETYHPIIERVRDLRVLLVITFRPEFEPPWLGSSHVSALTFDRLSRRQCLSMAQKVAGGKALPDEVLQQIVGKTDGVPLFVEELTKTVLEAGFLREEAERFVLTGPIPHLAIPATLQDSLIARLDRLAPVKEVAQTGATIGRQFSHDLLAAVSPLGADDLGKALDRLVESGLILRRGRPPEAVYRFRHGLMQDAAYESLLKTKRLQIHARIAASIAERFPEQAESEPEVLAHHYTEAGLTEQAAPRWLQAGQKAARHAANTEAVSHFDKGLELVPKLAEGEQRNRLELELHLAIGGMLIATEGYGGPRLKTASDRVRDLCAELADPMLAFRALSLLWAYLVGRGDTEPTLQTALEIEKLADEVGHTTMIMWGRLNVGTILVFRGEFAAALSRIDQALPLYDPQKHAGDVFRVNHDAKGMCLLYIIMVSWIQGYPERALNAYLEAESHVDRLGHPYMRSHIRGTGAIVYHLRRENARFRGKVASALALSEEQGYPYLITAQYLFLGWALAQEGEIEEAIATTRDSLDRLRESGSMILTPTYLGVLADMLAKAGRPEEGLEQIGQALAQVEELGERWHEAELHRIKGEILLKLEKPDEAQASFQKAIAVAQSQEAKGWELRAATSLARLWQGQDKGSQARDLLAPVYGWFTEGFDTADLKDAKALLEELG